MMNSGHRPIFRMIDEHVRRWQMLSDLHAEARCAEPLVAISRLPGCGGRAVAQALADRLGFVLFDKELVEEVAKRSRMSLSRVSALDEKARPMLDELVESLFEPHCQSEDYFRHLTHALLAIAERGRAVVLGRGAAFLLPPRSCLRVLLVAPLKARIQNLAERLGIPAAEARDRVLRVETDRRAFAMKHFHRDITDPSCYDIALNTGEIGVRALVDELQMAWAMLRERRLSLSPGAAAL